MACCYMEQLELSLLGCKFLIEKLQGSELQNIICVNPRGGERQQIL